MTWLSILSFLFLVFFRLSESTLNLVKVQSACTQASLWSPTPSLVQNLCLQCFCINGGLSLCRLVPPQLQSTCLTTAVTTTTTTTARPPTPVNATAAPGNVTVSPPPAPVTTPPGATTLPAATTTVVATATTPRPIFNATFINTYPFILDLIQSGAVGVPVGGAGFINPVFVNPGAGISPVVSPGFINPATNPAFINPGFINPVTGTGFVSPATGAGFVNPATGSGFINPVTGTGFVSPATGAGFVNPAAGSGFVNPGTGFINPQVPVFYPGRSTRKAVVPFRFPS